MTEIFNKQTQVLIRKNLRNNMTKSEVVLWKHLKGNQLGFKFRRQCGIGNYVVDFYCPRLKLIIEIDGLSHSVEKVFEKDTVRQKYLEGLGLVVKRYSSEDIFYKINQILEDVYQTCLVLKNDPSLPSPS
jgi:very-short-patch-repair endonuclease